MPKVLLVEDEQQLGRIVKDSLEVRGFEMKHAIDGKEGLAFYKEWKPDLVVLDIMMPGMDGLSLAKEIRAGDKKTPLIFLTARSQTKDVVKGFESGGNDYLKKPFSMDELIVRIKELLRRNDDDPNKEGLFKIGSYYFDYKKQLLYKPDEEEEGKRIKEHALSYREAELLVRLYRQKNSVSERKEVLQEIWGDDNFFNARSMDVFISKLRRYLKEDPSVQIINIRGVGYKLIC